MSDEDKAIIYGIVGGTPQYLLQMSDKISDEENIKNTYLRPVWTTKKEWNAAIQARKNGTATQEQKEMLDHGHWKANK